MDAKFEGFSIEVEKENQNEEIQSDEIENWEDFSLRGNQNDWIRLLGAEK